MKKVKIMSNSKTRFNRKEYMRKWHKDNKEQRKKYDKKYRKEHREQYNGYSRKRNYKLHDRVIDMLGGKCVNCGITDKRVLQVNHINNGGTKEFHRVGALTLYLQILRGERTTEDLEVRCANCNILYKWKDKERLS